MEHELLRLEKKLESLKTSNELIKKEIDEVKAYTEECDALEKIYGKKRPRGSFFGKMRNLPDFSCKWSKTVFWKYHNELDRFSFLTSEQLDKSLSAFRNQDGFATYFMCHIVMYCEMAIPTAKGLLLHLIDPFGERNLIVTISNPSVISKYVGRLLRMKCMEKPKTNNFQVIDIEILPYTLYRQLENI